jgi:hypothetical protein
VISDWEMPEMDGPARGDDLQRAAELKRNLDDVPVRSLLVDRPPDNRDGRR